MTPSLLARLAPLAALAAFGTHAQAPEDAPPRYEVEVLVFANTEFDPSEELFALEQTRTAPAQPEPLRLPPSAEDLVLEPLEPEPAADPLAPPPVTDDPSGPAEPPAGAPLGEPGTDPAATAQPGADLTSVIDYRTGRRSLRFRPLRPEELELGAERQTLERLSAYRPVLHVGWVQEVLSERDAQPFDLALLGSVAAGGNVRVHLSRFLHVTLDLTYRPPGAFSAGGGGFGLDEVQLAPRYQLRTERRIRSNEVNYFDHPAFGVLIVVRPEPEPEPAADAPATRPAA